MFLCDHNREWSKFLIDGRLAGLVYVVDSSDITHQAIRAAAEYVYDVLLHPLMDPSN